MNNAYEIEFMIWIFKGYFQLNLEYKNTRMMNINFNVYKIIIKCYIPLEMMMRSKGTWMLEADDEAWWRKH